MIANFYCSWNCTR